MPMVPPMKEADWPSSAPDRAGLFRHGIAVQSGGNGGRIAGDVEQDRAEGAAVHIGVVECAQHNDGSGGVDL